MKFRLSLWTTLAFVFALFIPVVLCVDDICTQVQVIDVIDGASIAVLYNGNNTVIQKLQSQPVSNKTEINNNQTIAKQSDEIQPQIVYITNSGKKYHKQGCKFLTDSSKPISIEEAKQKGYEPCRICFGEKTR